VAYDGCGCSRSTIGCGPSALLGCGAFSALQCEYVTKVLRRGDLPVGAVQRKLVELLEEDDDDEDRWCTY
jgi:hypothetical protein